MMPLLHPFVSRSMRFAMAATVFVAMSCASPMANTEIKDTQKSKTIGPIDDTAYPSPEAVKPLEFGNDRKLEELSYPVFPAGQVRFEREFKEDVLGEEIVERKKATPVLCRADDDCRAPDRCLRPAGSPGLGGACGQAFGPDGKVDETQRFVQSCKEQWECPEQFDCVKVNGPYGLCVRLQDG